ncbi:hypothetical protein EVAR_53862_1 [Eumeta japonica]|uniref:Uncharacterized protein n=1 Tax=Eumeta variegata TaxID=151549 RepID=A0A4C1XHW9_EUMVA|nr:hypothetical protein EVAR_53862_1 [Eumeta japonica]
MAACAQNPNGAGRCMCCCRVVGYTTSAVKINAAVAPVGRAIIGNKIYWFRRLSRRKEDWPDFVEHPMWMFFAGLSFDNVIEN